MRQDKCPLHMGKCSLIIRKMHNETTMRPFTPTWWAKISKSDNIGKIWNKDTE